MPAASDDVFLAGLDAFGAVVERVGAEQWEAPSTCAGWSNLDVLGHLGSAVSMGIGILSGATPGPPSSPEGARPGDAVPADRAGYWPALADDARAALVGVDLDAVIESPMGARPVRDGLAFPAIDLFVHAWDIGHSCGVDVEIPADVIEFAHTYLDPYPPERMRGEGRPFGAEVDAPADSSPTEAFIAWTGRSPR